MSITQVEATKISERLAKELEAMRALCKYHAEKTPSPYFRPIPDPSELNTDEDHYPPQFYYFCNLVSVPRQIEIFRFSYFIHVEEMVEKLLSAIVDRSLTEAALLFRYYLEITASFFVRMFANGPIAQLDRASDFESEGWAFESLWDRQTSIIYKK